MRKSALSCVTRGRFLLPGAKADMERWAVIACDQHTSEREYWEKADAIVGDAPSALRLVLPEIYLNESESRIPLINRAMENYLRGGVFEREIEGMILTVRHGKNGLRPGIVLCADLEEYSYEKGALPLIRPTEGTILSRIPPRLEIRRDAALELSHVLLLIDDPDMTVIEPALDEIERMEKLYDTPLMLSGGRAEGYRMSDSMIKRTLRALECLPHENGAPLIAVGDGNHSLATAKAHWENVKKSLSEEEIKTHPARCAMAELTNLHSPALRFEPIHRAISGVKGEDVLNVLRDAGFIEANGECDARALYDGKEAALAFAGSGLPLRAMQDALDKTSFEIDYIHGEDALRRLEQQGRVCLLLPAMDKSALFPAVAGGTPLPRKTFSMGEAEEKRYYIEARRIR